MRSVTVWLYMHRRRLQNHSRQTGKRRRVRSVVGGGLGRSGGRRGGAHPLVAMAVSLPPAPTQSVALAGGAVQRPERVQIRVQSAVLNHTGFELTRALQRVEQARRYGRAGGGAVERQ
jgi:hypothetical protein